MYPPERGFVECGTCESFGGCARNTCCDRCSALENAWRCLCGSKMELPWRFFRVLRPITCCDRRSASEGTRRRVLGSQLELARRFSRALHAKYPQRQTGRIGRRSARSTWIWASAPVAVFVGRFVRFVGRCGGEMIGAECSCHFGAGSAAIGAFGEAVSVCSGVESLCAMRFAPRAVVHAGTDIWTASAPVSGDVSGVRD